MFSVNILLLQELTKFLNFVFNFSRRIRDDFYMWNVSV